MTKLAIIYHSAHGHTEHIALRVLEGAQQVEGVEAHFIEAEEMATHPHDLVNFDGFILGSPTYLGGVSGPFKSFMDATGRLWRQQGLVGKLAAGFTVSSLPAGDKQSTLMSMFVFAMQHGMLWVGAGMMPANTKASTRDDLNNLGMSAGLMTATPSDASVDEMVPGDLATARAFGARVAAAAARLA